MYVSSLHYLFVGYFSDLISGTQQTLQLPCMLCRSASGRAIGCSVPSCTATFHVTCILDLKLQSTTDYDRGLMCARHVLQQKNLNKPIVPAPSRMAPLGPLRADEKPHGKSPSRVMGNKGSTINQPKPVVSSHKPMISQAATVGPSAGMQKRCHRCQKPFPVKVMCNKRYVT